MAVKASSNITLYHVIDVASVTIYYLLQSSTANPPAKPTTDNPGGNWSTIEPTYTEGSTNTLYTVTKTKYSDGTFEYTPVSKSSSYEAAKSAYNIAYDANQKMLAKELIVGTQTAATNVWTGIASFASLHDGQEILYWLPWAGNSSGATLNLTLSGGNTTGAKNVYYGGTSRVTIHYSAGSIIRMVYRENVSISGSTTKYTGWWCDANYTDGNNTDRLRFQNNIKTNKQYIWSNRLLVSNSEGYFPLRNGITFDRDKAVLWAGSELKPWINTSSNNNYISYAYVDLRMNGYWYWNPNSTSTNKWAAATKFGLIDAEIASGKKILSGTTLSGTGTDKTGVAGNENDYYINTNDGKYYICTTTGNNSTAKWDYKNDSTIPGGKRIYWGNINPVTTATLINTSYVGDRYINFNTGRLYECILAGASGTAQWEDKGLLIDINKTVYLKCELHEHSITVDDVPFTTEIPTIDDGKIYIAIGLSYSHYQCGLFPEHPIFMFKDGFFKSLEQITYDSLALAKKASTEANDVKGEFQRFLEGDESLGEEGYIKFKSDVTESINELPGIIEFNFDTYFKKSTSGQQMSDALKVVENVKSYIKFGTTDSANPYIELGRQPDENTPYTYRLRIENNEIYMVYGDQDTTSLTKLTRWFTEDGNSSLVVNSLLTQQEMAINPFKFIKNDDGSLSFRKIE